MSGGEFHNIAKDFYPYHIPELTLTEESALFREIVKHNSFSQNLLRGWNYWTEINPLTKTSLLNDIFLAQKINTDIGTVHFSNPIIAKPKIQIKKNTEIMTPKISRERDHTYSGKLTIDVSFRPFSKYEDKNPTFTIKDVDIGNIPIMVGSKNCHLSEKTMMQKINMGECPNDPFSYFIIKGTEKTIPIQEKLRTSLFIAYTEKKVLEGRFTCNSPLGTSLVSITVGKNFKKNLKVKLFHMKSGTHIPIFILFQFLGISIEDAVDMILSYVKEENRMMVYYGLQPSIIKAQARADYVSYLAKKRDLIKKGIPMNDIISTMITDINNDLFADIAPATKMSSYVLKNENFTPIQIPQIEKATNLAYMIGRMVEIQEGLRPIDNRDSSICKKYEVPSRSLEQLFIGLVNCIMTYSQENISFEKTFAGQDKKIPRKIDSINERDLLKLLSLNKSILTDQIVSSFNANSWGVKCNILSTGNKSRKENITDTLKRETPLTVYSQNDKINTPSSRNAPRTIRELQDSQFGRICIAETPEGENCGLVKHLALTTYLSLERPSVDFIRLLQTSLANLVSYNTVRSPEFPRTLMINGRIHAWAKVELIQAAIDCRRRFLLPIDVAIIDNEMDNTIEYYCDGSRPCRPLLIVENGELLIEKRKLWKAGFENLYKEGVIELLDVREEEMNKRLISDFPSKVLSRETDIAKLRKKQVPHNKPNLKRHYTLTRSKENIEKVNLVLSRVLEEKIGFTELAQYKAKQSKNDDMTPNIYYVVNLLLANYSNYASNLAKLREEFVELENNFYRFQEMFDIDIELEDLISKRACTHSEIHPIAAYGISAGLMPAANHNQGPRITYQASMGKQASGDYHVMHHSRMSDSGYKILVKPARSLWESEIAEPAGLNVMPSGQSVNIAIISDPYNMEDAIIFNKDFIDSNNFEIIRYHTHKSMRKQEKPITERFMRPNDPYGDRYHAINKYGIPKIGAFLKKGDCIIGKVREISETAGSIAKIENASVFVGIGEEGFVERVEIMMESSNLVVKVKMAILRKPLVGDKFASRYSQKGTIGDIRDSSMMPRVAFGPNRGVVPDIMINACSQPSRMTLGMIEEMFGSAAALYTLERINATTYNKINLKQFGETLEQQGLDRNSNYIMCHPNGKVLEYPVFFGHCTYQALRHHVKDKVQLRARGAIKPISHQPSSGRQNGGGLRLGEMEHDAMVEQGASGILNERLMRVSDEFDTVHCAKCGTMAVSDMSTKRTVKLQCSVCKNNDESLFGKLTKPYVDKLITHCLNGYGITRVLDLVPKVSVGERVYAKYLL